MSQALTKLEATIEAQTKKLAALKLQKQRIDARKRAKDQGLARRQDTRKKVLAGAMLLEAVEKDPAMKKWMLEQLSGFLVRPDDRTLFGLKGVEAKA